MNEKDFLKYCNQALENLAKLLEENDTKSQFDIEYSDGILKITIDKTNQTFIINRHSASQKIWYSSPFSGVDYFSLDSKNNSWLNDKNINLLDKIHNELQNFQSFQS